MHISQQVRITLYTSASITQRCWAIIFSFSFFLEDEDDVKDEDVTEDDPEDKEDTEDEPEDKEDTEDGDETKGLDEEQDETDAEEEDEDEDVQGSEIAEIKDDTTEPEGTCR